MKKIVLFLNLLLLTLAYAYGGGEVVVNPKLFTIENLIIKTTKNPCYSWGKITTFYTEKDGEPVEIAYIAFENKTKSVYVHSLRIDKSYRNHGLGGKIIKWFKQYVITNYPKAQSIDWNAVPIDPDDGETSVEAYKRLCNYYKRQNAIVVDGKCHIPLEKITLWQRLSSFTKTPKSRL